MSCSKHPQRKRKDCPGCFPPVVKESVSVVSAHPKATTKATNIPVQTERTSREMLADMEKEVEELVIKPERAKKTPKPEPQQAEEVKVDGAEAPVVKTPLQEFEAKCEAVAAKVYEKYMEKIYALSDVLWEHLEVPDTIFTLQLLYDLEREGWKWCQLYDELWNKASGLNQPRHHLLQRVKNSKWPAKPDLSKPAGLAKYIGKGK